MNEKKKTRAALAEVQNMTGKTQWAKLVDEEKSAKKSPTDAKTHG